jgi:hypothetical protein
MLTTSGLGVLLLVLPTKQGAATEQIWSTILWYRRRHQQASKDSEQSARVYDLIDCIE